MIHKKIFSKMILFFSALGVILSIFFCPVTTLTTHAAVREPDSVCHDIIDYRFVAVEKKLYKRLYNYSTGNWAEPEWHYVCDLP